jgi:hypothetical protein
MGSQVDESLRALLEGDLQQYPERTAVLDEQGWNAFGELVGSAFHRAVGQRFLPGQDRAEIAKFVEEAGRPYIGTPVEIDTASGEALVHSVLGDTSTVADVLERFDEPDLARIELVLLRRLIADAGLTGAAFEKFLEESVSDARPWSGEDKPATDAAS